MKSRINPEEGRKRKAELLCTDFPYYARHCLKIRGKSGDVLPLVLNRAQLHIHRQLETQAGETGRIRALILKGRQQGCSTYVEARFFHKTSLGRGLRAFILSHEADSALNLFNMAKRYYEHCPAPMRPATERSNRQELVFAGRDCSYRVATAGADAVGRSETVQLFHGSEVAFWPHAEDHASGVLQAVGDEPGTEVILESTANGLGNLFHQMWVKAEQGFSDYLPVFIPWYWQSEYQRKCGPGFRLSEDESGYQEAHGICLEAMAWRRTKIAEIGEDRFRQEYPATAAEAFQTSGKDALIAPELILAARKGPKAVHASGARIGGCDPAGDGEDGDRTAFVIRQGRIVLHMETTTGRNTMEVAGRVARLMRQWGLDKMFIDKVGIGAGVVDRARELAPGIIGVNAGERPLKPDRYFNKRAEMWGEMAEWFAGTPVAVPDDDELQADLMTARRRYDSNSRLKLDPKEKIREEFGRSPDLGDALALTFAYPVVPVGLGTRESRSARARREYNPIGRSRRS